MTSPIKNQVNILEKLSIEKLNAMQEEAQETILSNPETVLLSPTGTGKTLAFLLPLIAELDINCPEIQALMMDPRVQQLFKDLKENPISAQQAIQKDQFLGEAFRKLVAAGIIKTK